MATGFRHRPVSGLQFWRAASATVLVVAVTAGGLACSSAPAALPKGHGPSSPPGGNSPYLPTEPEAGLAVVSSISPSSGTADQSVAINGVNLGGVTAVCFGAVPGSHLSVVSGQQVTVISPSGSGTVSVTVLTPDSRTGAIPAGRYTYLASGTALAPAPISSLCRQATPSPDPSP